MLLLFFQYKNTKRTENESLHRKTEREREVDASLRVRERANSLSLSLSLSLSFKSSLFASARERDRRFLLSFLFPQQRRELIFSFFVEGAEELFWRQFFLLLSLSLSSQKISLRSYYFITQRCLCAEPRSTAPTRASKLHAHLQRVYIYQNKNGQGKFLSSL